MANQPTTSPTFSFGIIADIQYADKDDGSNFAKTKHRFYRGTLSIVDAAVNAWNNENIVCVVQMGDIIDGFCKDYSKKALGSVLERFKPLRAPLHHVVGNHELYNFSRNELSSLLFPSPFYYSFTPFHGFRFIILNSYERSVYWRNEPDLVEESYAMFEPYNPNQVRVEGKDWMEGVTGLQRRFAPFNGGISDLQIEWLRTTLLKADEEEEKVVVFSHCPLQEGCSSEATLLWNYEEVLQVIHDSPATIICCLYGHCHTGGYCEDELGLHHITLPSPLESAPGNVAFAFIDIFESHVTIRGHGDVPTREKLCFYNKKK